MNLFTKKETGDAGETSCVKYLKRNGYKIVTRNFRKPYGEIDVIAKRRGVLCFVEVKTRREGSLTQPYEAVTRQKQQRIIRAAQAYLLETHTECPCRFDVCEVIINPDTLSVLNIRYIENAFET